MNPGIERKCLRFDERLKEVEHRSPEKVFVRIRVVRM